MLRVISAESLYTMLNFKDKSHYALVNHESAHGCLKIIFNQQV